MQDQILLFFNRRERLGLQKVNLIGSLNKMIHKNFMLAHYIKMKELVLLINQDPTSNLVKIFPHKPLVFQIVIPLIALNLGKKEQVF